MKEFRTSLTIKDPKSVVLSDLPFSEGQEVEVVVVAKDEIDTRARQLRDLLKATQALPDARLSPKKTLRAKSTPTATVDESNHRYQRDRLRSA